MTDKQIKQNAYDYTYTNDHNWTWDDSGESRVDISTEISDAYLAGAHSRDDEIKDLQLAYNNLVNSFNERERELAKASQELNQLRNPWISVEDRLPEEGQRILVLFQSGAMICDECFNEHEVNLSNITHWMPIPELTKGNYKDEQIYL